MIVEFKNTTKLNNDNHFGGSLKILKKTGNVIESGFKQAGKEIVKTANDVDKWAKKVDLGGYVGCTN